jgi:ABC-type sulfate/molybdate transport systems ATPase subunit
MPNFLIIDEGFGCMDNEHLNNTKDFLMNIQSRFDYIVLVSHIDNMIFNNALKIVGVGSSEIKFGEYISEPDATDQSDESAAPPMTDEVFESGKIIIPYGSRIFCLLCRKSLKATSKLSHEKAGYHKKALEKYETEMYGK